MASFCYRIRSTQKNKLVKIQIFFTVGRGNQFYADSQYMVLTDAWVGQQAADGQEPLLLYRRFHRTTRSWPDGKIG